MNAALRSERPASLWFTVRGIPITQGPTNPSQVKNYPALAEWRNSIVILARAARRGRWSPVAGTQCVSVFATFRLRRPKTGPWRDATFPGGSKDLDKLQRALGDAMETAGVYLNDSQVVDWVCSKRFARRESEIGVEVLVVLAAGDGS